MQFNRHSCGSLDFLRSLKSGIHPSCVEDTYAPSFVPFVPCVRFLQSSFLLSRYTRSKSTSDTYSISFTEPHSIDSTCSPFSVCCLSIPPPVSGPSPNHSHLHHSSIQSSIRIVLWGFVSSHLSNSNSKWIPLLSPSILFAYSTSGLFNHSSMCNGSIRTELVGSLWIKYRVSF